MLFRVAVDRAYRGNVAVTGVTATDGDADAGDAVGPTRVYGEEEEAAAGVPMANGAAGGVGEAAGVCCSLGD
jgi:hypothetical protein